MTTRIQLRRGNASSWTTANPVLALGEAGIETNTLQWKVGDGTTTWANLSYMSGSTGSGNALVNGDNSFSLSANENGTLTLTTVDGDKALIQMQGDGTTLLIDSLGGNVLVSANDDVEWKFDTNGALNLPTQAAFPKIQSANAYPTIIAYGSAGDGGPELDWTNSNDIANIFSNSSILRNTMYINDGGLYIGMNENGVANTFAGNWRFDPTGTLSFPDNSGEGWPVQEQRFGMGNIGAWLDGQWTIGEFSGNGVSGEFGIRIDPSIEGSVGMTFPASASSNTQPVQIYSTNGGGINLTTGSNEWVFDSNGIVTLPDGTQMGVIEGANTFGFYNTNANTQFLFETNSNYWQFNGNTSNLESGGGISVTGNIAGSYFIGNGSQLTGITSSANTGNVTFSDVNIIGTGNLNLQPDANNSGAYLDVYLTAGPDIHVAGNGENLILGRDDAANVTVNVDGNVTVQAWDGAANTWTFGNDGTFTTPGVSGNITGANVVEANTLASLGNLQLLASEAVWTLNNNGSTVFPTQSVQRGDTTGGTITGQTILFGDKTQEAIISTLDGDSNYNDSQRLVINPGAGAADTDGEGGDIYLWAGRGGNASGSGGDIKIRGGQGGANTGGGSGGDGGYIRIEAGDTASTGGQPGYVEVTGGISSTAQGGYVQILGGNGQTVGGDANVIGGYGVETGGNVNITGGVSGNGLANYGNVNINAGASNWRFDNAGNLTLPHNGYLSYNSVSNATVLGSVANVEISSNSFAHYWRFDSAGNLTLPDVNNIVTSVGSNANINLHPNGTGLVKILGSGGVLLNLVGEAETTSRIEIDTFGSGNGLGGAFTGTFSRGNISTPAAVQAGDTLATLKGKGFDGSVMSGPVGLVSIDAFQNWSSGNTSSQITFWTTGYNTADPVKNMSISPSGNVDIYNGNLRVNAGGGYLQGNVNTGNGGLYAGIPGFTILGSNVVAQFAGNANSYSQLNFQNTNDGIESSGDFIITANNGDDTTNFINVGIAGNTWDGSQENSLGTAVGANDGYLYVNGANLVVGTYLNAGNVVTTWKFDNTGNLTAPGNISLDGGRITGGVPTVVNDGINSIALGLGAQMDVFGFPFSVVPTRGQLTISGDISTTQAIGTWYYQAINTNTYQLYTDSTYTTKVDSTTWTAYGGGGTVAITKQSPAANIVIDSNGFTSTFTNTGELNLPGAVSIAGVGGDITMTGGDITGVNIVVTVPTELANLTAVAGGRAFINDGNLVATGNFGAQVAGGAGNTVPVWSDGANWYIG